VAGDGATYGILGTLAAFPRRLAAREVLRQGAQLRGGGARNLTHVVFGRSLLDRMDADEIAARADTRRNAGIEVLSENGFRRRLGLIPKPSDAGVSRQSLIDQSKLPGRVLDLLSLFDAFESDAAPYSFRDVILARKYEKLVAAGASWADIARSVHRVGKVSSLTALALHGDAGGIYRKDGDRLSEIDGQGLLPFDEPDEDHERADELFEAADAAEREGDFVSAALLYGEYLRIVPNDAVAAFNRANALRDAGRAEEAGNAYTLALKLDPKFAEAWFNYGQLLRESGRTDTARAHFLKAIGLDPDYADPVFNLAALEYDAQHLPMARQWWTRYLELDGTSDWARKATRGIQLIDLTLNASRKRGA
jgi:tetratricopeptide (TPR) repeat protein